MQNTDKVRSGLIHFEGRFRPGRCNISATLPIRFMCENDTRRVVSVTHWGFVDYGEMGFRRMSVLKATHVAEEVDGVE